MSPPMQRYDGSVSSRATARSWSVTKSWSRPTVASSRESTRKSKSAASLLRSRGSSIRLRFLVDRARRAEDHAVVYAAAFGFVANQGDGWQFALDHLDRTLEELRHTPEDQRSVAAERHGLFLTVAKLLGQRTAGLHRAFALPTEDQAFAAEPVTSEDLQAWLAAARAQVAAGFATLENARATSPEAQAADIDEALKLRSAVEASLGDFDDLPWAS